MGNTAEVAERVSEVVSEAMEGEPGLRFMLFVFQAGGGEVAITGDAPFEVSAVVALRAMQRQFVELADSGPRVIA